MAQRKLTARQRKFIALYDGNGTDTARKAGYKGSDDVLGKTAFDLLRNPKIVAAIQKREQIELQPKIANRQQRQEFWTRIMNNNKAELHSRLKASELLGKSEADFTDKMEVSGHESLADRIAAARKKVGK